MFTRSRHFEQERVNPWQATDLIHADAFPQHWAPVAVISVPLAVHSSHKQHGCIYILIFENLNKNYLLIFMS